MKERFATSRREAISFMLTDEKGKAGILYVGCRRDDDVINVALPIQ